MVMLLGKSKKKKSLSLFSTIRIFALDAFLHVQYFILFCKYIK